MMSLILLFLNCLLVLNLARAELVIPKTPPPLTQAQIDQLPTNDGKCRCLSLRGGGTKGAYEVGVLNKTLELMPKVDLQYDVVEGISAGAINAAILSTFHVGDEQSGIETMTSFWSHVPVTDIWQNWPVLGPAELLWRPSVFDNAPLVDVLHQLLVEDNRTPKRQLAVLAVDLNTGELVIFDETTPQKSLAQAVAASASIPTVFPPTSLDHKQLADGGVFANLDVSESIIKCREDGFADEDIIIDVIMCFDSVIKIKEWLMKEVKYKNAYALYERNAEIRNFYYYFEDLIRVVRGYPKVNFRHLISPLQDLSSDYIPIFDGIEETMEMYDRGLVDAEIHMEYYANKTGIEIPGLKKRIKPQEPVQDKENDDATNNPQSALNGNEKHENSQKDSTDIKGEPIMNEDPSKKEDEKRKHPNVQSSRLSEEILQNLLTFDTIREIVKWQDENELKDEIVQ